MANPLEIDTQKTRLIRDSLGLMGKLFVVNSILVSAAPTFLSTAKLYNAWHLTSTRTTRGIIACNIFTYTFTRTWQSKTSLSITVKAIDFKLLRLLFHATEHQLNENIKLMKNHENITTEISLSRTRERNHFWESENERKIDWM